MGMIMSTVLTRGVRQEAQQVLPVRADERLAAENASPNMVVCAWIWTAVIAYFALQAVFN
jgi:hypothetical protein